MSSVEKSSAPVLDIIAAKSPANQYLVRLLEERGAVSFQPPTEERVQLVFKVLDSLIPQLGVFCRVLGLIREELHGAVYSQPIPGAQHLAQSQGISAVPYFSLVFQMQSDRNEDVDAVRAELHSVNATLSMRDEELQCLREKICNIQEINQTLRDSITALQLEAEENQEKCKQSEKEILLKAAQLKTERQSHKQSLSNLHEQLQASSMKIQEMTQLTQDYQALQTVFQSPLTRKKQNMLSAVGKVPPDRTAFNSTYISTYLQATGHMYKQLLQVQNRVLDDFDHYLENCTSASETDLSHPPLNKEMQMTFLSRLAEISEELLLLEQHREGLEQRNARSKEVSPRTQNLENMESAWPQHTESQEKVEERNIENIEWFLSQALYPDETLLNHYAVMIYTSADNGRIFEELEGATVCDSCGQKTILCPHKVRRSQEIHLPRNCTHMKICRPQAHVSTLEAKIARSRVMSLVPPAKRVAQISDKIIEDFETQSSVVTSPLGRSLDTSFCRFEEDLEKQVQQRRGAPRMLSQKLCRSLAQRLFLSIVLQLEGKSPSLPIQETVRQFFNERYVNRDISAYGLVDFWATLKRDSSDSKVLCLLRSVLEEDMDPAILHYVLLRAEMVESSPLSDLGHFRQYIHKLYPFLEENEQDSLLLEFTGYSQRFVSPFAVMGFILHLILQHQEPLIRECEDVLSTHVKTRSGHLTPDELSEALTELCPFLNRTQIELSIQRSTAASGRHFIPLHSAAQIAAFQMERAKHHGNETSVQIYGEEERRSGNTSSRSEDLHDFQLLHNLLHQLKCQKP